MAKLNLTLPVGEVAVTGKQITFVAPCNSEGLTHLIIGNDEFELVDSNGNALISGAFVKNAMVSVILYTDIYKAYIQNADINAYLDAMFAGDQKPVYAVSATLTDLTSGEKLSIAFGKIAKAVKDFIAHLANTGNPHSVTKKQVGLEFADNTSDMDKPVSTAQAEAIAGAKTEAQNNLNSHNVNTGAHNDIRLALTELSNWVKDLLDSDDETLNEMHEVVAYIKSNKALIDAITISKVNVADIVNDLVTNVATKPLSAAQGVAIKALIDALQTAVNGKAPTSHSHSKNEITDFPSTMPPSSHSHTKSEITDFPSSMPPTSHKHNKEDINDFPSSMNPTSHASTHKKGGADALSPEDIGALPTSGGTLTGNVRVTNNNPYISLVDSGTGDEAYMQTYTENGVLHVGFGYGWDASLKISRHGQALANANGQTPSASVLRNSKLVTAEENPTVNGEICWLYE